MVLKCAMKKYSPRVLSMLHLSVLYVVLIILIQGCKLNCSRPKLNFLDFGTKDSIGDSIVIITKYDSNSDFTRMKDSSSVKIEHVYPYHGNARYYFDPDYHYRIIVYPSGKIFTLKYIKIGADEMNSSGSGSDQCTSAYSYYLNDALVYVPETTSGSNSSGSVTIRY